MPRKDKNNPNVKQMTFPDMVSTATCVPAIREAVKAWRDTKYKGVTDVTRELLNWWFYNDHRLHDDKRFEYHYFQREAIETLIYLWEVERIRKRKDLLEKYARSGDLRLPIHDDFIRYAVKMATGSGKTKVMSLAVVWQYFNAVHNQGDDYAKTFLVIAPNVIVFERLRDDFEGGKIFRKDPMKPKSMDFLWEFDCVLRDDGERAHSDGTLYLTNIHQLYERDEQANSDEPEEMLAVLGPKPKKQLDERKSIRERIAERDSVMMVINDEAHHTHDEKLKWNEVIRDLHAVRPVTAQLDFSATPRFQHGGLFPWTVYDYPLKQAMLDNVVKRPVKGIANIQEAKSDLARIKYQGFLVAGVKRWEEYAEQLAPLNRKPILFIMLNETKEADDVGNWLRERYTSDFGGDKTLIIHTDNSGEVSKKDLDTYRDMARKVDSLDSPVNAVVSVLMLREGWDVQNVTVVVGLRPFAAKANILPEQTIGRGLRLMFRGDGGDYKERVDVIGNKAFIEFVEELERMEEHKFDTFEIGKDALQIITIWPMLVEKGEYDIGLPQLSPALVRKQTLAEEINGLDVFEFPARFKLAPLPKKPGSANEQSFKYEGFDILTLEMMIEREYQIPEIQTPQEIVGYYAQLIAANLKLPSQFAVLAPKVQQFLEHVAFGETIDINDPQMLKAMSHNNTLHRVCFVFWKALADAIIQPMEPELQAPDRMLSTCPSFPYSKPTYEARKCIFNLVPCDNQLERTFAKFLDNAPDVLAFAKLPDQFGFAIEYVDNASNKRFYYPDFVVKRDNGEYWLVETKGYEGVEVQQKDRAAIRWCESATMLTGTTWRYLKVPQKEFEKLQPADFEDVTTLNIALD